MLWSCPYIVIARPSDTDIASATFFSRKSPQLWVSLPRQFSYSSGVSLTTGEHPVDTHGSMKSCVPSQHHQSCFLLHCFIWFTSKSKRKWHLTKPKLLFLLISKFEPGLWSLVYFRWIPENPLLQLPPWNKAPNISSKERKLIIKQNFKIAPMKRGVVALRADTWSLCMARLCGEAIEPQADGLSHSITPVPCSGLSLVALWVPQMSFHP